MADKELIEQLWESDAASALTNQAAREIEKLEAELQQAINERNAAWCQLEEAGMKIRPCDKSEGCMTRKNDYDLFFTTWMARTCFVLGSIVLAYLTYEILVNSIDFVIIGMIGIVVSGFFCVAVTCGRSARRIKRATF